MNFSLKTNSAPNRKAYPICWRKSYASHLTKDESQIILYFLINQKIQIKMIRSAVWKNQKQVKIRVRMPQNH
jgi:hypothetical protein